MVERNFILRPNQSQKFRSSHGEIILRETMEEILSGQQYEEETVEELSIKIMVEVRNKLKALSFPNYKYIIQVMIGVQRGQGVNVMSQCMWDTDCDGSAKFFYSNVGDYSWQHITTYK